MMPVFITLPNQQRINIDIIEWYEPVTHDENKTIIKLKWKEPIVIPFAPALIDKLIQNASAINSIRFKS